MTEQNAEHPTSGRRRRYKSPPTLHDTAALPVPRLADHLDTENGPSDEEGEKEAKRQRSEPTTPISTSSRLPHEYDEVMGITQVDPREAERFEEGLDLEYHDASENPPCALSLSLFCFFVVFFFGGGSVFGGFKGQVRCLAW